MNLFHNLTGQALPEDFEWLNPPKQWEFTDGRLEMWAPNNTDFFLDPRGNPPSMSAPFLYTNLTGNFQVETKVEVDMQATFDSGCLMLMVDSRRWAKLCYEYTNSQPSIVSVVTSGFSDDCNGTIGLSQSPHLRISRVGNSFAFHYSLDGNWWELVRYFYLDAPEQLQVGVVAQSPSGKGCQVSFSHLEYSPEGIIDIRSGK